MTGIQCRKGHIFSMIVYHAKDAEWKLQEAYYIAHGCEVVMDDEIFAVFDSLDCFSRQRLRDEVIKFK